MEQHDPGADRGAARLGGTGLDPGRVAAFARGDRAAVDLAVPASAREAVARAHGRLVAAGERARVYGLTTGVGALRAHGVEDTGRAGHARRLLDSHAAGFGPELPAEAVRATMLVRLHQLLRGGSGVHPDLVDALASALAADRLPRLRGYGSIGTGDLTLLAQLALALCGHWPWHGEEPEPVALDRVSALPFISSNAATVAAGGLAVADLEASAAVVLEVAALSHLALQGATEPYAAAVHAAKDDREAAAVAARLRHLLGTASAPRRVQDPFALRSLPQAHAPLDAALAEAARVLTAEADAAAENPLVAGEVIHHGQFLTHRLAAALEALRQATYPTLSLSAARVRALVDPTLTGLPAFLADGPAGSSGLMVVEYVAADVLARTRAACAPRGLAETTVSLGLEEQASFSSQAAAATAGLAALVPDLLACELVCAVRALRLAPERVRDVPARALWDAAAARLPDVRGDHVLGPELDAARDLLVRWAGRGWSGGGESPPRRGLPPK